MTDILLHRFPQACDLYARIYNIFLSGGGENLWQPAGFSLFVIVHPVNTWTYVTTSNCICYGRDQPQLSGFHHHITPVYESGINLRDAS